MQQQQQVIVQQQQQALKQQQQQLQQQLQQQQRQQQKAAERAAAEPVKKITGDTIHVTNLAKDVTSEDVKVRYSYYRYYSNLAYRLCDHDIILH